MTWKRAITYAATPFLVFFLAFYVTVSVLLKGAEDVICPDVKGKTVEEARRLVEEKGLGLEVTRHERRRDVPYNHVTIQKPEPNMSTRKGRVVLVIVSDGPPLVEVPVLEGLNLEQAEEMIKVKGLLVERTISVPGGKAGRVMAQTPKGGENLLEGKGVVLFTGTGRAQWYLMPAVGDLNPTDLSDEMEAKGIKAKLNYARGERFVPGSALNTSVSPRTLFKAGEEIEIKVNIGG